MGVATRDHPLPAGRGVSHCRSEIDHRTGIVAPEANNNQRRSPRAGPWNQNGISRSQTAASGPLATSIRCAVFPAANRYNAPVIPDSDSITLLLPVANHSATATVQFPNPLTPDP